MKILMSLVVAVALIPASGWSQKSKKTPAKKPIIRETVTIKVKPYVEPEYPIETEPDLWKEYSTRDGSIRISFPAGSGKYFRNDSEVMPDGPELVVMSAYTKNASYKLMTRPATQLFNNSDIDEVLEASISSVSSKPGTTIISKMDVSYAGFIGKELVLSTTRAEGKEVQYARLFLLNGTVIAIYVTLDDPNSGKAMETWIRKFFDSMVVKMPLSNDG